MTIGTHYLRVLILKSCYNKCDETVLERLRETRIVGRQRITQPVLVL
jgi:hypothetical protein